MASVFSGRCLLRGYSAGRYPTALEAKLAALLVAAGMHETLMMAIAYAAFHLNIMSNLIIIFKLKQ
jgi:hypothetical protein